MFGLPAACLAMYHTARPERKAAVGEPVPVDGAYRLHHRRHRADRILVHFPGADTLCAARVARRIVGSGDESVRRASGLHILGRPDRLSDQFQIGDAAVVADAGGHAYFALYYGVFRFTIQWFDLETPGREAPEAATAQQRTVSGSREEGFVAALGGAANLISVDACATRLRLIVADQSKVNEAALKALGARGLIRPSDKALQIVLGPMADQVASDIRAELKRVPAATDGNRLLSSLGGGANLAA